MSGVLRSTITRYSRTLRNSTRNYGEQGLLQEQTGRPPKMYIGVEKPPKLGTGEKAVAFAIMMVACLAYPSWVLYHIPEYKMRKDDD